MMQSPYCEANWFAASQEIPRISRNPKVHYRTHKLLPPVSILGQPNPVHIPTSQLLEIHPNIIHPSTPRSPQWSLSLRFPPPRAYTPPSPHPHAPHALPILITKCSTKLNLKLLLGHYLLVKYVHQLVPRDCRYPPFQSRLSKFAHFPCRFYVQENM